MNVEESALRVTWPDNLEENQELFAGIQKANKVLGEELGRSKDFVTANWKLDRDGQNRILLELTLTDLFTKCLAMGKFAPDELRYETQLGSRIHRLWGQLLQARSDGQIKRLKDLVEQVEGE